MWPHIFCSTPTGQMAAPSPSRPGMLPGCGSILRGVDFWEVPFALMLSPGWKDSVKMHFKICEQGTNGSKVIVSPLTPRPKMLAECSKCQDDQETAAPLRANSEHIKVQDLNLVQRQVQNLTPSTYPRADQDRRAPLSSGLTLQVPVSRGPPPPKQVPTVRSRKWHGGVA